MAEQNDAIAISFGLAATLISPIGIFIMWRTRMTSADIEMGLLQHMAPPAHGLNDEHDPARPADIPDRPALQATGTDSSNEQLARLFEVMSRLVHPRFHS